MTVHALQLHKFRSASAAGGSVYTSPDGLSHTEVGKIVNAVPFRFLLANLCVERTARAHT